MGEDPQLPIWKGKHLFCKNAQFLAGASHKYKSVKSGERSDMFPEWAYTMVSKETSFASKIFTCLKHDDVSETKDMPSAR